MGKNVKDLIPGVATHPGEVLKDELEAREIKQKDFASEIDVAISQLNEIIKGKRSVTPDFAVLLESALGIDAQFWVNMQANYNLDLARIKEVNIRKQQVLERWQVIKNYVAVNYFRKLGLIEGNPSKDESKLYDIFGVKNLEGIIDRVTQYNYSLFRKSEKLNTDHVNLISWVMLVEYKARDQKVGTYKLAEFDSIIKELKQVFNQDRVIENSIEVLSNAGIKVVILDKPQQVPVDGMSFWSGKNPAIGLSLRYNRLDNFAFTLLHELGHVVLHLKSNKEAEFVDNIDEIMSSRDKLELEANQFAANNLVNPEIWKELITTCFNFTDGVIENFAKKAEVHPAILRGRICNEFNKYYKVRTKIDNSIR